MLVATNHLPMSQNPATGLYSRRRSPKKNPGWLAGVGINAAESVVVEVVVGLGAVLSFAHHIKRFARNPRRYRVSEKPCASCCVA